MASMSGTSRELARKNAQASIANATLYSYNGERMGNYTLTAASQKKREKHKGSDERKK